MKNGIIWNTELALNLESLFYKDSVTDEYMKMVDRLSSLWQEIADFIGFDLTNEDAVNKIKELGTDDPTSALCVFDNAEEAIDFFQDMRTINARKALFYITKNQLSYSVSVQALIKFCREIITASPVVFHQKPNVFLENMICCMCKAIEAENITYGTLRLFHKIIHDLEKYQVDYEAALSRTEHGKNISKGKQQQVEWRKKCFDDFELYLNERKKTEPKLSICSAAQNFYSSHRNEEIFTNNWRDYKTFYQSFLRRKKNSKNKNRKRQKAQQEKTTQFALPPDVVAALSKMGKQ